MRLMTKGNPKSGAELKFADPFNKGKPNLSACSPQVLAFFFLWRGPGGAGENTAAAAAAATEPPSALSISINAAGCLTSTRNTARLNTLAYHFPPSLSLTLCRRSEPNVHYHAVCLGEREGENGEEYRAEIIDSLM